MGRVGRYECDEAVARPTSQGGLVFANRSRPDRSLAVTRGRHVESGLTGKMSTVADRCCTSSPPSTTSRCPVMYRASSLARNTAGPARSLTSPTRPSGMFSPRAVLVSRFIPPLSIEPGTSAFTRTAVRGEIQRHGAGQGLHPALRGIVRRVSAMRAGRAAARQVDDRPRRAFRAMICAALNPQRKTLLRFTAMIRSHHAASPSRKWRIVSMRPALLTSTSTVPKRWTAVLNKRSTCEASETSAATATAEPPAAASAWTTASAPAALMSFTTTCAPSRANRSAIARPIPPAAPVTITVFPDTVPFDVVTGAPAHPERRGSILSPILPDAASPGGHQHAGHAPNHVAGIVADQGCQHEQQGRWSSRAHPAVLQLLPGQRLSEHVPHLQERPARPDAPSLPPHRILACASCQAESRVRGRRRFRRPGSAESIRRPIDAGGFKLYVQGGN